MNSLGIVFSNIHDNNVPELTSNRTIGAIPFGGRYRLIDFTLSNMVNSGITHIGCVTKRNYRSLIDHIGSGKDWDLARKNGGFVLLPPFGETESSSLYSTRLEALKTVLGFIRRCDEDYIVLSDSNSVYNIDFNDMQDYHIAKKAAITLLYVEKDMSSVSGTNNAIFKINGEGRINEIAVDPFVSGKVNLYGNVCFMKRELLVSLVSDAIAHGKRHFMKEVIASKVDSLKIVGYKHGGYFEEISSLQKYYDVNMALLEKDVRSDLFGEREIYTKIKDSTPTHYGANSVVSNSLISDGCHIEGEVYNSVIFRGVKIGRGTVVRDSVIMKNSIIGDHVTINSIITDKNVVIRDRSVLSGSVNHPFYIRKNVKI